jgi:hypothetical protein
VSFEYLAIGTGRAWSRDAPAFRCHVDNDATASGFSKQPQAFQVANSFERYIARIVYQKEEYAGS